MFKLNSKFDTDSFLYSLSHFESNGHTVHMLTHQCLPPTLTSTETPSLFTHAHSSPLSLAARLHRCHANCSHYINNGWAFSAQTWYVCFHQTPSQPTIQTSIGPPTHKVTTQLLTTHTYAYLLIYMSPTCSFKNKSFYDLCTRPSSTHSFFHPNT